MTEPNLPFDGRVNDIFPTRVWVADLSSLQPIRDQLVEDAIAETLVGNGGRSGATEPVLQDRDEPWWRACLDAADSVASALAASLRPPSRCRSVYCWADVRSSASDYGEPVDPQTTYQAATFSGILWLQIPDELQGKVSMAFRDPLFHLNDRLGWPAYADVVPTELRLMVFPGYLERFTRTPKSTGAWAVPTVSLSFDFCYY